MIGKFQKEPERKFKKSWKWMLSATSLFLVAFMALFAFKADDRSEAAITYYLQGQDLQLIPDNSSYEMRGRKEIFSLADPVADEGEVPPEYDKLKWTIDSNDYCITFGDYWNYKDKGEPPELEREKYVTLDGQSKGGRVTVYVNSVGTANLNVELVNAAGETVKTVRVQLVVKISINDYIPSGAKDDVKTVIARDGDTHRSFVMNWNSSIEIGKNTASSGSLEEGENSKKEDQLNLNFGFTDEWISANPEIVGFVDNNDKSGKSMKALSPGHTTIIARYKPGDGTSESVVETEPIDVYVRPSLMLKMDNGYYDGKDQDGKNKIASGDTDGMPNGIKFNESNYSGSDFTINVEADNKDKTWIEVQGIEANSVTPINSRITWVITKVVSNGVQKFVCDSENNVGQGYTKDVANLEWQASGHSYKFSARAGTYVIYFYVAGVINTQDRVTEDNTYEYEPHPGCDPVKLGNSVTMLSNYRDVTVTLNVGGKFSIADCFNMTADDMSKYFNLEEGDFNKDEKVTIEIEGMYLDKNTTTVEGYFPGEVTITVRALDSIRNSGMNEFADGNTKDVRVTIQIIDTLSIIAERNNIFPGGEPLELEARWAFEQYAGQHGIPNRGTEGYNQLLSQLYPPLNYTWSIETAAPAGLYSFTGGAVEVKERKTVSLELASGAPAGTQMAVVKVRWVSGSGMIEEASYNVYVGDVNTDFEINPQSLVLNVGESRVIELSKRIDVNWISSNTEIATVEDRSSTDVSGAMVTAVTPGSTTIVAYNINNGAYAVCEVTVLQPATGLDIIIDGQSRTGQRYDTVLSTGYVFASVVANPEDTTETEFVWTSDNPSVATVDETGRITLVSEGITIITVSTASGSHSASCTLAVVAKPITSITTDVSELDMIVGDTYTVSTQIEPADASNNTLEWVSSDQGVANVDNAGRITATGVGTAVIRVIAQLPPEGGRAAEASINVTVRNRLTSISFDSNVTYINVGGTKQINVIFTPASDVNTNVTFRSSDESIFTVDANGVITGVAVGQAILTCTAEDLGEAGVISCIVHVTENEVLATDFVLTPAEGIVYIGSTLQIEKTFTPEDATDQFVTWTSSDPAIATVNQAGLVTGVALGKVTITAAYTNTPDGVPWIRTSSVEVQETPVYATDFDVTPASQNILVGEKFTIVPVFTPANATNQNVDYQSLDEGVVSVDEKGVVTGIGAGDAVIQAQAEDGGFIATCAVHVDNAIKFSLSPEKREIAVGKSFKLKKVTDPANAKKTATWSTSNAAIARVNSNGKVTGRRIGSCTIRCVLTNYNQRATCRVKVAKLRSTIKLENKNIRIGVGQTYRLKKTVWSNNTHNPGVKWKTSNKRIVAVSGAGKLTGKRVGLAKVTAVTTDSVRAKAVCKVRVIQRVSKISLNTDYMVVYVGGVKKLNVKYRPAGATIKKVKFKSGNSKVARVTGSGRVRGIAEGDTFVTATAADGSNKRARCYVKVMDAVPATSIVVAQTNMTMQKGDSAKISYRVLPENTSDSLKFASDNKRVAKVNNKGRVKAVGTGNAVITIMSTSGVTSTVDVNVVAFNKSTLNIRQFDTETLIVHGASDTVTWYSSNARVATVDDAGKVVGRSPGTAYIYAYINGCRVSCRVVVSALN